MSRPIRIFKMSRWFLLCPVRDSTDRGGYGEEWAQDRGDHGLWGAEEEQAVCVVTC